MRKILFTLGAVLLGVMLTAGGVVLLDRLVVAHLTPDANLPGLDLENRRTTMRTLEMFPYTGWHMQANFHEAGHLAGVGPGDYDIQSGPMGFFMDFDPENPPPKKPKEIRIILIGGSGAQGWGGLTNDDMFYKLLERNLNQAFAKSGYFVRVINMAMGASTTYQNFIALNQYAHRLSPDLIVSYSGRNDFFVPVFHEDLNDGYYFFNEVNALALASRASEMPPGLKFWERLLPNTLTRTSLGYALKVVFFHDYFLRRAKESYRASRGITETQPVRFFWARVVPQYIHALQSIKRDFDGIPMIVAWQAMSRQELKLPQRSLGPDFYNEMFEAARKGCEGYQNDKWLFINIHQMLEDGPQTDIATHLGNSGHRQVANILSQQIMSFIQSSLVKGD